jgi:putative molybdopterin biosynthesis protein
MRSRETTLEEISHIGAIGTVRVLANEERLRLLRLLMRGPATLTQLGASVGHHPAWVRHHILSLEQAGLVELVETRPTKGYVEKFYCATARAYAVDFMVLPDAGERGLLVILGSDDVALDLLARCLREDGAGPDVITMAMGSLEGLIALRHGIGHVAGCHLFDAESGDFNKPFARALFPGRELVLITLAHREQGLIVPHGNPGGLDDLAAAVAAGARLVNRNRGSGTRVWVDRLLTGASVDPVRVAGYDTEMTTHEAAARAVAAGAADVALGIRPAASAHGLDFVPLIEERYDLVTPREHYESGLLAPMLSLLNDDSFKQEIDDLGGYVTRETGAVTALSA